MANTHEESEKRDGGDGNAPDISERVSEGNDEAKENSKNDNGGEQNNDQAVTSHENNEHNHRSKKKKRHRHRSRGSVDNATESATTNGVVKVVDGDMDRGESEDSDTATVLSSSTRRRRSRSGSRHRKHKNSSRKDPVSGDDSGLSLGNSLNESSPPDPSSSHTAPDVKAEESLSMTDITQAKSDDVKPDESECAESNIDNVISKSGDDVNVSESVGEKTLTSAADNGSNISATGQKETKHLSENSISNSENDTNPSHDKTHTSLPKEREKNSDVDGTKKASRMNRRLERQNTQYKFEKIMLQKRLDDTKEKFKSEIEKYEQNLSDQRQEYLDQLSSLRIQDQYESLSVRINDLTELEEQLDARFKDCLEQQKDVEEMERFLNMREALCKNRETDITKLDDELDAWQGELDIKKRQLEMGDGSKRRNESVLNASFSKATTDEEDYILKKNLQKCKADLTRSEEENTALHKELDSLKKEHESSQAQQRNQEKRIKQLESQLTLALSQLGDSKSSHLHKKGSLPPINGHIPDNSASIDRIEELKKERARERSHVMLQRLNSSANELSINQQAALRRKLAGKDASSSGGSSSKLRPENGVVRKPSTSVGSSHSEDGGTGDTQRSSTMSDVGADSEKSSPTTRKPNQTSDKSTICVLM